LFPLVLRIGIDVDVVIRLNEKMIIYVSSEYFWKASTGKNKIINSEELNYKDNKILKKESILVPYNILMGFEPTPNRKF
jgi:hypothetical protein